MGGFGSNERAIPRVNPEIEDKPSLRAIPGNLTGLAITLPDHRKTHAPPQNRKMPGFATGPPALLCARLHVWIIIRIPSPDDRYSGTLLPRNDDFA